MRKRFSRFCGFLAAFSFLLTVPPAGPAAGSEVVRETLDNGMRVVVIRNTLAPVVTTEINYLAGSNEAPAGFPGMAHAQEHMMFRGSENLSAAQLANIAAAMGGDFDADTQQTVTQYFFTVPAADLDIALHIESIRLQNVLDEQKLWEKERGAIDQEVARDLSNPEYLFYTRLLDRMFSGTPFAHDALGTKESFAETTGAMLQEFHQKWYAPNNAVLVIVGDVDPQKALAEAKRLFGSIPSRPLPERPKYELQPMQPSKIEMTTDLPYGMAVVAYRLPGFDSSDYAAAEVLADVLGSTRARLYGLVPEGKALYAGFSGEPLPIATIGYAIAAYPQGGDGEDLVATMKKIVGDYVAGGVPADLVEASKRHEVADAEFEKNSIPGLASAWSQALAVEGRKSPDEIIEAIKAVTVEDVNRVARKYLVNETAITAVLTPQPSGKPVTSGEFGGKESFAPKQAKHVDLPDWAKKVQQTPKVPSTNVHPSVYTLANGMRLIVQPENISPTVSVFGQVKNNPDLETPKGQEGVDDVLGDLFSYGTTTLDRLAFQKALDDIGAHESAGTSFSLQVLSDSFDRGVELLASNLLHPALPEPAFRIVQKETAGAIAGEVRSPGFLARRARKQGLYPKEDPELRYPTPASVSSLSIGDVRDYYTKVFRPDLTTIVVVGGVKPGEVKAVIEKHFGAWRAEGPRPETTLPAVPPNPPSTAAVPDPSRIQNSVTLSQTIEVFRSDPDYYALQVGNHVLSGGFYATRLFRDLREEAGLVYTVESGLDVGKTRSTFSVYYACDPPNVGKARALVEKDLREMQTAAVSATELEQAKTLLIRQIPLSEASEDSIAEQLLSLSVEGLPLDERIRAAKHYVEITAPQVQAAFAKYIRPKDFVQVTLGPAPK